MIPGPKTSLTLQRVTETSDGMGGMTQSWGNITTLTGVLTAGGNTSTRFAGQEKLITGKLTVTSTLIFFCDVPVGITITEKDRFILGARIFDIIFVYNPGNMNHHLEISVFEVK
jgi:head-tail adaptor